MTDQGQYIQCGICSTHLVVHPACGGSGCVGTAQAGQDCKDGYVCPKCCEKPYEALRGAGWSPTSCVVALKPYKQQIHDALDRLMDDVKDQWVPTPNQAGTSVMREAWIGEWHFGVSESRYSESVTWKGMVENESRGVKCRLPSAWVQRIRDKTARGLPGRSE